MNPGCVLKYVLNSVKTTLWTVWKGSSSIQIARAALGKYIIAFACLLHITWAVILMIDVRAVNATPLAIIYTLCNHDRVLTIVSLLMVSLMAGAFLDIRLRRQLSMSALSLFLVPQQLILWCSGFNSIYCTIMQRYADGTPMSWPHIGTDQAPVVMMALLYTVALLESRHPPTFSELLETRGASESQIAAGIEGMRGPQGIQGIQGVTGAAGKGGQGGQGGQGGKGGGVDGGEGLVGKIGELGK